MKLRPALLILALVAIAAFSCHKKDDNGSGGNLMGQWNGTRMEIKYQEGALTYDTTFPIKSPDYFKLNFKSQNQVDLDISFQGDNEQGTGYYMVQGNQLTIGDSTNVQDRSTFTYNITDSQMTLISEEDTTINNQTVSGTSTLYFERE